MRYGKDTQREHVFYDVLGEKHSETRVYKLLRFSYTRIGNRTRKKILDKILAEEKTIGTIDWFEKGGIIHEPKEPFEIITISEV